jgi:hypothetical protein
MTLSTSADANTRPLEPFHCYVAQIECRTFHCPSRWKFKPHAMTRQFLEKTKLKETTLSGEAGEYFISLTNQGLST